MAAEQTLSSLASHREDFSDRVQPTSLTLLVLPSTAFPPYLFPIPPALQIPQESPRMINHFMVKPPKVPFSLFFLKRPQFKALYRLAIAIG